MPKRILFIVPSVYPQVVGGTEVFNFYLIQELGKFHDVFYVNADKQPSLELEHAERIKIKNTKQLLQLYQIIVVLIKMRNKYDLIWTSFSKTAWYYIVIYPIINLILKKEYLIVIHGGGLMPWKWKMPYQWYFERAKAVVGVSDRICNEYHERTNVDIRYLPPLIPFKRSELSKSELRTNHQIDQNNKIFLFVGSLKPLKGPEEVVNAFIAFGRDYLEKEKIQVIFAGTGPLQNRLMKKSSDLGFDAHMLFKGNIPREVIHEWYKLSDYYIIASDFEGTPIAMLEAMFNQLPIIASNVQGINSVINEDNGILFDKNDDSSLRYAIEKVVHDSIFSEEISRRAHLDYQEKFNYHILLENYNRIYA